MSEEEKDAIDILKRTIKNSNYCDSIGIGQIEIVLNYIDKLQKELKDSINARFELQRRIDKIKEALGDKNIPDEMILTYIETLVSENARLEDIEDRKVQIEYNNVFNKGVKSVEDKIRTKIKELAEGRNYIIVNAEVISIQTLLDLLELLGDDE